MQCKTKPGSALHAPESLTLTGLIKALPLSETGATSTNPQSDLPCCVISLFGREDRWTEVWRTTVVALHPKSLHSSKNKKNSSLPSCWSSPVMSVETMRLLTNWLVVSVLRLTVCCGLCLLMAALSSALLNFSVLLRCGCSCQGWSWPHGSLSI